MTKTRYPIATFTGLFIALVFPFILDLLLGRRSDDLANPARAGLFLIEEWILALILLGIVLFWERQPLASIGIKRMSWRDVIWAIVAFLVGAVSFVFTAPIVNALGLGTTSDSITQLAQVPISLRIGIVITAGVTEEILFRGYPIERLKDVTGRLAWGAVIAYLVFVVLHIPFWGIGGTIQIGVWSIVVTVLYIKRRNLFSCMLMHILNDAYAFLLLPMFFAQYLQ
ncbi:MAG: type II CAAX endopeptidase family protein [Chloroflexaceae bacterium]